MRGRFYVAGTEADGELIPPAVAAYAVESYSQTGGLVVDPDCGAGTVLVEAVRAGRHAVGMTVDSRWWDVARANLSEAKREGAWLDGGSRVGRRTGLGRRADFDSDYGQVCD